MNPDTVSFTDLRPVRVALRRIYVVINGLSYDRAAMWPYGLAPLQALTSPAKEKWRLIRATARPENCHDVVTLMVFERDTARVMMGHRETVYAGEKGLSRQGGIP